MPDSDLDKITPTDISLTAHEPVPEASASAASSIPKLGMGDAQQQAQVQEKNHKILWGIFGLLLVLVLGVIFILPRLVSSSNPEPTVVVVTAPTSGSTGASTNQISPFQEAQILRQREDAQNVLAALLALQELLIEKEVNLWAEAEMTAVLEFAQKGDEAYRRQAFLESETEYAQGLERLQEIESSMPATLLSFIAAGNAAILSGEPMQAEQAFTIAFAIDPQSLAADNGLRRSQVLGEVLNIFNQAAELHQNNLFEDARGFYQQALNIDSEHQASRAALTQVGVDILDRDFSAFMSQGYAALQSDEPSRAQAFFRQALSLKADSSQAIAALEQAGDQIIFDAITIHLDTAQIHVNAERWAEALSEYQQALIVDPNLVSALEGRNLSNSRNNLDNFLQNTLAQPLRLAETGVYQQARDVYADASNLPNPGSRLTSQLQQIASLLEKATQAVDVAFLSNGLTSVTIARVSNLGLFTSQTLSLTPGAYVALGVRDGFRDVRQEFIVPFDGQAPLITVQCDEAI